MAARARWKELCMDAAAGEGLGRWWADVLGLEFHADGRAGYLTGPTEGDGIAMCLVPEEKTAKHRVHIDVCAEVPELVARGASMLSPAEESGLPWTVLADPEGGEFCAFPVDAGPKFYQLIVDAVDAEEIARWWADVLGAEVTATHDQGWRRLEGVPGAPFEAMLFGEVPEPKTVKNRLHWDVHSTVAEMEAAGALVLWRQYEDDAAGDSDRIAWTVMADPEGNEFCVFEP